MKKSLILLTIAALLTSCAMGPNFKQPAPPSVKTYTPNPLVTTSSTTNVAGGEAQHFVTGQDIAGDWWTLFHSEALNSLIERSLKANPDLKAAQAALVAARENVQAQRGYYYPTVAGSFSVARQKTSRAIAPVPNDNALYFSLYTPQVTVSYTPDVFGLNRRTVESLKAQEQQTRFALVATHLALTANVVAAAIQEASLRAQIVSTRELVTVNSNMLQVFRNQLARGYAGRLDVAAQEAQLAQIAATLPPLLKQLAQQRDLLAALSGGFPSEGPAETFELSGLHLPLELPLSLEVMTRGLVQAAGLVIGLLVSGGGRGDLEKSAAVPLLLLPLLLPLLLVQSQGALGTRGGLATTGQLETTAARRGRQCRRHLGERNSFKLN